MSSSLFLKHILDLTDEEFSLFSKIVNKTPWGSFKELIELFPEDNSELIVIRTKIQDYIDTPASIK